MKSEQDEQSKYHHEFDFSTIETPSLLGHAWVQMGMQLICQSCQREHAVFLRPGFHYQGNDEKGKPILKKVW